MADKSDTPSWHLVEAFQGYRGFAFGCRYPSLVFVIQGGEIAHEIRDALWLRLHHACPALITQQPPAIPDPSRWPASVQWLLCIWQQLQEAQSMAVFETGRILSLEAGRARCLLPLSANAHQAMARVVQATLKWLAIESHARSTSQANTSAQELEQAVQLLSRLSPKGSNVPRFLKAAYQIGMPAAQLPGGIFQYGHCNRARWLDSSFTDATPTIAAKLARNKAFASALLAQAGLPVSSHIQARDTESAVQAAHHLGYPVVVKPADLDGGAGVAAGLETDHEVRQAFDAAAKHSRKILVEKHNPGKDYRLTVFHGQVIWAVERIPGGIMGDGKSTIAKLIDQVNADPRRGEGRHAPLKRLRLDQEAQDLLMRQGFNESSIPSQGQFVRLRRAANVASGGQPVAVFDKVHPDNARLAVRAAELLRLDLAGIDLLIKDVSKSWRDPSSHAAICEVNGQPNLGQTTASHLYGQILRRLVPGCGRVPTVLVLGASEPDVWLNALARELRDQGLRAGTAGPKGVRINDEVIHPQALKCFAAGQMLALNRCADAMLMIITEESLLTTGLPWQRFDALLLAGKSIPNAPLKHWLRHLLPGCDGLVMSHKASGIKVTGAEQISRAKWLEADGDPDAIAKQLVREVLRCHQQRNAVTDQSLANMPH